MKKYIAFITALLCLILSACGTDGKESGSDKTTNNSETVQNVSADGESETSAPAKDVPVTINENGNVRLSFAESIKFERIKQLEGRTVEMIGYMAKVSPVHGKYLYLMNLPYQSCPYCVPNTQQLSNTVAVYAKEDDPFKFTDAPINVVGTLEIGEFKDEYGYEYNYRISDAVYEELNTSEASEKLTLWRKITDSNLASDVYAMFDYIDLECNWPNYTADFGEGSVYLYPADVSYFEEYQYTKQSAKDYFENMVKSAKDINDGVMDELVTIINDGEALVKEATDERETLKNYSYDEHTDRFTLNRGEELMGKAQALYTRYANWLENFSLSN